MGLLLSLEGAGTVLGLEKQKLTEGKDLIKFFCQPCAPTKSNGGRIRNLPLPERYVLHITYEGVGGTKKWERLNYYGPKFVENIVQAISRDIFCCAMKTLRCCSIVMHIHDELVIEADPPNVARCSLRTDGQDPTPG